MDLYEADLIEITEVPETEAEAVRRSPAAPAAINQATGERYPSVTEAELALPPGQSYRIRYL